MNRRTQQEMEEIEEQEDDYVNASRGAVDEKRTRPGRRFVLLTAVCWIILSAITGLRIYLTSELYEDNAELYSRIQELETRENLTDQLGNLTEAYTVSESNNKNLSAEVQELKTRNQVLETEKKNLKQQIQNMTTNWNELNVSRAQWSINAYCLGNTGNSCQPCQKGWDHTAPSCYELNYPPSPSQWKTWEEAREDCSGKNSDLAVARNPAEKEAINANSDGAYGFWIGLRVEDGKWKWVDGSDLTDSSSIAAPVGGRCAMFVKNRNTWYSESCERTLPWLCQKKALTLSV